MPLSMSDKSLGCSPSAKMPHDFAGGLPSTMKRYSPPLHSASMQTFTMPTRLTFSLSSLPTVAGTMLPCASVSVCMTRYTIVSSGRPLQNSMKR